MPDRHEHGFTGRLVLSRSIVTAKSALSECLGMLWWPRIPTV